MLPRNVSSVQVDSSKYTTLTVPMLGRASRGKESNAPIMKDDVFAGGKTLVKEMRFGRVLKSGNEAQQRHRSRAHPKAYLRGKTTLCMDRCASKAAPMSQVTVVGISGPSSSGKTTLARLLRDILQAGGHNVFILHEDDFYVTDKDIPIDKATGYQDWDCLESIDVSLFAQAVEHIKSTGQLPPDLQSKEDQNSVGKLDIDQEALQQLKKQSKALQLPPSSTVALIDGFLLYTPALETVYSHVDLRLFLPVTRQLMLSRRAARSGYVTLEGFWEDPPGYVEKVVWPNYAKDHAYLFQDGNIEGELEQKQVQKLKLQVAPRAAMEDMTRCLDWAATLLFQTQQQQQQQQQEK